MNIAFLKKILKISKKYFALSAFIFFLSFLGGVLFAELYPALAREGLDELQKTFSSLFHLQPLGMALFLFFNNSLKILLFILLGTFFALPTLIFLILNGWVLGYVSTTVYPEMGLMALFQSLFFHGVFELTALFLGTAMGFWIGISFYREIRKKEKSTKKNISFAMDVFFHVILPLLAIAAVIETYLIFFV